MRRRRQPAGRRLCRLSRSPFTYPPRRLLLSFSLPPAAAAGNDDAAAPASLSPPQNGRPRDFFSAPPIYSPGARPPRRVSIARPAVPRVYIYFTVKNIIQKISGVARIKQTNLTISFFGFHWIYCSYLTLLLLERHECHIFFFYNRYWYQ